MLENGVNKLDLDLDLVEINTYPIKSLSSISLNSSKITGDSKL